LNPIKCVIIDDEELARKLLETYVERVSYLKWEASFENPLDGLSFLKSNPVDLLFLDIQMPQLKGTAFAELIAKSKTQIIFTTAYSEYAIKGFELNVLDYLLKPITFKRFLNAVERFPSKEPAGVIDDGHIVIKSGYNLHREPITNILYVESDSEYVHYYLESGKKITSNQSLTKLQGQLPPHFLRIHRSFIVNGQKVMGLKGRELQMQNSSILPISNTYYEEVKSILFGS